MRKPASLFISDLNTENKPFRTLSSVCWFLALADRSKQHKTKNINHKINKQDSRFEYINLCRLNASTKQFYMFVFLVPVLVDLNLVSGSGVILSFFICRRFVCLIPWSVQVPPPPPFLPFPENVYIKCTLFIENWKVRDSERETVSILCL